MVCHFVIYLSVTAIGKETLSVVATTNAAHHLLFPFQLFDFLFLYAFFSLRTAKEGCAPQATWKRHLAARRRAACFIGPR